MSFLSPPQTLFEIRFHDFHSWVANYRKFCLLSFMNATLEYETIQSYKLPCPIHSPPTCCTVWALYTVLLPAVRCEPYTQSSYLLYGASPIHSPTCCTVRALYTVLPAVRCEPYTQSYLLYGVSPIHSPTCWRCVPCAIHSPTCCTVWWLFLVFFLRLTQLTNLRKSLVNRDTMAASRHACDNVESKVMLYSVKWPFIL